MPLTSQDGLTDVQVGDFVQMAWDVSRLFPNDIALLTRDGATGALADSPQPVTARMGASVPPGTEVGTSLPLVWEVAQVFVETGTARLMRHGLGGHIDAPTTVTLYAGARTAELAIVAPESLSVRRLVLPFSLGRSGAAAHPDMLPFGFAPREESESVAPVLTALLPNTAAVGVPSFTLRVHGLDFDADSVIVFNGFDEPTTFVSETEVRTGVDMTVWTAPSAPLPVQVRNGDGVLSNVLMFTFTAAAPGTTSGDPMCKA